MIELNQNRRRFLLILKDHIVNLADARNEVFDQIDNYKEERKCNFFNLTNSSLHMTLMHALMGQHHKYKFHANLKEAYDLWILSLAPAYLPLKKTTAGRKYALFAKFLAGCLFTCDEYSKAVICLAHAVKLDESDAQARLLLLYWLCYMRNWHVAAAQLALEQKFHSEMSASHYYTLIEVMECLVVLNKPENELRRKNQGDNHQCNASSKQRKAIYKLLSTYYQLEKLEHKTYMQYEALILIKRGLIDAANFSNVDIERIGNPLRNMEIIKARYETLIRCRSKLDSSTSSVEGGDLGIITQDAHSYQESNINDYVKFTATVAEQFNLSLTFCRNLLDAGVLRECEGETIKLWLQSYKLANFNRCIMTMNVILLTSTLGNNYQMKPNTLRSIVASMWNVPLNPDGLLLSGTERTNKDASKKKSTASEPTVEDNVHIIDLTGDNDLSHVIRNNEEEGVELEKHNVDCQCVFCCISQSDLSFDMEIEFTMFVYKSFSTQRFKSMAAKIREMPSKCSLENDRLYEALEIKNLKKNQLPIYPSEIIDLFLSAVIRWLQKVGEREKSTIRKRVITESLRLCSSEPLLLRCRWLTIRQLNRAIPSNFQLTALSWLRKSGDNRSPLMSIFNNLTDQLNSLSLTKPHTCRDLDSNSRPSKKLPQSVPDVNEAITDFNDFGHLFHREWRFYSCCFLSHACFHNFIDDREYWHQAFFLAEATCIATRALSTLFERPDEDSNSFRFESVDHFKQSVACLPKDLTVIQLFLDHERILWLVRLHHDRPPLVIPIALISKENPVLNRFFSLLKENDDTAILSTTCKDPKIYWGVRRRLDEKLKGIVGDAESDWFGLLKIFLSPCVKFPILWANVIEPEIERCGFSKNFAYALTEMVRLRPLDWRKLVERLAMLENLDFSVVKRLCSLQRHWFPACLEGVKNSRDGYLVLSVPPELASFPFESLPIVAKYKRVCRISSFFILQNMLLRSNKIPKLVDATKSYYVLDPGGDLHDTQKRLAKELQKFPRWKGKIGAPPRPDELTTFLETNDLFFYMGHGSGGKYFGRSAVLRSNCRAVSLLMGCSSVRIINDGDGFDGRGVVYDYMIAKCPCVIGCLWMVTDGEIDRVLLALLGYCFNAKKKNKSSIQNLSYRLLIDGLAYARTACKLPYLTGGAVVAYGLPIATYLSRMLNDQST